MKITYLSTFYPYRGGIAQFNANLYRALSRQHQVTAYNFKRQYPDFLFPGKTQYVAPDDRADRIDSAPLLDSANPFSYLSSARRIASEKPELLLMRYWMPYFAPSLGTVGGRLKKKGCRVLAIADNIIPHEKKFFDKPLTRWFIRQCSGFIVMSESVRDDLLSLAPEAPYMLKPHPLYNHFGEKTDPATAKRALGLDPDKKTLLFFGLIRDYKGLDLLIEAMNALDGSYQLLIGGECYGSFDKYEAQIRRAARPENIHVFNRYIVDSEVPLFFSAADVCVQPYRSATQSGILAIAYHFDVPLVVTDAGGLKESIVSAGTGLVCPEISAASVAETVGRFYAADREQFRTQIRKIKSELSWENFAGALTGFAETL